MRRELNFCLLVGRDVVEVEQWKKKAPSVKLWVLNEAVCMNCPVSHQAKSACSHITPHLPQSFITRIHYRGVTQTLFCCAELHKHTGRDLLADRDVFQRIHLFSVLLFFFQRQGNEGGGVSSCWKQRQEKLTNGITGYGEFLWGILGDFTGSSCLWPSWRPSSGSLRIRVNSLMNTASPSMAHTPTWETSKQERNFDLPNETSYLQKAQFAKKLSN